MERIGSLNNIVGTHRRFRSAIFPQRVAAAIWVAMWVSLPAQNVMAVAQEQRAQRPGLRAAATKRRLREA